MHMVYVWRVMVDNELALILRIERASKARSFQKLPYFKARYRTIMQLRWNKYDRISFWKNKCFTTLIQFANQKKNKKCKGQHTTLLFLLLQLHAIANITFSFKMLSSVQVLNVYFVERYKLIFEIKCNNLKKSTHWHA